MIFINVLLLLLAGGTLNAQVDSALYNGKARYIKKAGKKAFKKGDYFSAIAYYKKYLKKKPDKLKVKYQLAEAYRLSRYYAKAEETYLEIHEADPSTDKMLLFRLAKMQQMNGHYEEAKDNYIAFKKAYKEADASVYKKQIKYLVVSCDSAIIFKKNPIEIEQHHLDTSINKAHIDFSPRPINDTLLLYASIRSDSIVYVDAEDSNAVEPVRKFYWAKKTGDTTWTFIEEDTLRPFNQEISHNGNGCYNLDSTQFYFTRGIRNWKQKLIFSIYVSEKTDTGWSEPKMLPEPINSKDYHALQPTIGWNSAKEVEVLYFVSSRPGGKGGRDIWYCEWQENKGVWKKPKNCGGKINTPLNEVTPSYYPKTKTMYFASDGWPGMGGLDVFKTSGQLKDWTTPKNIGYPLNTNVDELYYNLAPNGKEGYFVSNRIGSVALKNPTCCHDIYHWSHVKNMNFAIEGDVYEQIVRPGKRDSIGLISTAVFSLYKYSDSTEVLVEKMEGGKVGEYFFDLEKDEKYKLKMEAPGYFTQTHEFNTLNKQRSDTLLKGFIVSKMSAGPLVIKNIFYEYDKADLTPDSKMNIDTTLLRILVNNPQIIVEIGSHTDSRGSHAYNRKLSQRRAESVMNYLVTKGIDRKRMRAKGYGEVVPVAPNDNPDGSDNVEGRAMNRRTEFKVVGTIEGITEIIYEKNKPTDSY